MIQGRYRGQIFHYATIKCIAKLNCVIDGET